MTNINRDKDFNGTVDDSERLGGQLPEAFAQTPISATALDFDPATQAELDNHDHSGETLSLAGLSVSNAPSSATDVTRQQELDNHNHDGRYIRGDQADSTENTLGLGLVGDYSQALGAQNESARISGTASDLLVSIQQGQGRASIAWNAFYENAQWNYIVGGEGAGLIGWGLNINGSSDRGAIVMARAPPASAAGDTVSWSGVVGDADGFRSFGDANLHSDTILNMTGGQRLSFYKQPDVPNDTNYVRVTTE